MIKTNRKIVVPVGLTIMIAIIAFLANFTTVISNITDFFSKEEPSNLIITELNVASSDNQSGGITAGKIEIVNPPLPTPTLTYELISINIPYQNSYKTDFTCEISSTLPLQEISKMKAVVPDVCSCSVQLTNQFGQNLDTKKGVIIYFRKCNISCVCLVKTQEQDFRFSL